MIPFHEQWTLGMLIDALAKRPDDQSIRFDFAGYYPGELCSHRGFYECLAIIPTRALILASETRRRLGAAVGQDFAGYKGGVYRMTRDTPLWVVSDRGDHSSTIITGIEDCDYMTILRTKWIEV